MEPENPVHADASQCREIVPVAWVHWRWVAGAIRRLKSSVLFSTKQPDEIAGHGGSNIKLFFLLH